MATDPGLRRLALGTLLAAFPGAAAPDWGLALLADGLAGFALFGGNITGGKQLTGLVKELISVRGEALVALDEEGGDVTRLAHRTGSPYPGNAALGAVDDPELTRAVYAAIGADLVAVGVNLDLAPTVDVNSVAENPIIGTRSFGADTTLVARHTSAAVLGLQSAGVAACAKHFPGHGATVTDSHLGLPTVDVPLSTLRERDLPPFAAAVDAGVKAIMTAHIRVPALTGTGPATFSRRAVTGLLREEYGFDGVVVTDALEMRGASVDGVPAAAVKALRAGADLLCIGALVNAELVEAIAAEIVAGVADGRLELSRLEEAARRTANLAASVSPSATGRGGDAALGLAAARRALRVEGDASGFAHALVVQLTAPHTIAEGKVPWGFWPLADGVWVIDPAEASAPVIAERAGSRPVVVVGRRFHESASARDLVERLAATNRTAVVEMGWPSAWRPSGVAAFLTTFGASRVSGVAAAETLGVRHHD